MRLLGREWMASDNLVESKGGGGCTVLFRMRLTLTCQLPAAPPPRPEELHTELPQKALSGQSCQSNSQDAGQCRWGDPGSSWFAIEAWPHGRRRPPSTVLGGRFPRISAQCC